jgi:hypothetical protein
VSRETAGRLRRVLLGLVVTTLVVTGCGVGDDSDEAPAPAPTTAAPATGGPGPTPTPRGTATVTPAPGTDNPFGAHWDWSRYTQFEPYLRKLSGSATYHELTWCAIEKSEGQRNWAAVDRIAQRSRDLGIALHLKIRIGVCWATGGTPQHVRGQANKTESAMPRDLATYQEFVRAVVDRYRPYGVRQYAVENEVNAQQYWAGTPEDYIRLVRAAAEAIHSADPQAQVVDSGISSVAYGFGVVDRLLGEGRTDEAIAAYRTYFQRRIGTRGKQIPNVATEAQLRTALAHATNVRNLAYLAATEELLDAGVVQVRQVHYYEHFDGVPALLEYLTARTPAGVPIEAWEVGQFWRDGDADATGRAHEMVKVLGLLLAGGIRQVMWLPLGYNPNNRAGSEVRYGLLDPDGTQREAGAMMADLVAAARGATVTGIDRDGLTGVAFQRPDATTLVLWSRSGAAVTVPAASGLRAGPLGGAARAAGSAGVTVTGTPVVLHINGSTTDLFSGGG